MALQLQGPERLGLGLGRFDAGQPDLPRRLEFTFGEGRLAQNFGRQTPKRRAVGRYRLDTGVGARSRRRPRSVAPSGGPISSWICWRDLVLVPRISRPPAISAAVSSPSSDFSSPNTHAQLHVYRSAAGLLGQQQQGHSVRQLDFFRPGLNVGRRRIEYFTLGDLFAPLIILEHHGQVGAPRGSRPDPAVLSGMNSPYVRLDCLRYALATRSTSSGVTLLIWSRSRNSRRQSPSEITSLSASAICCVSAMARSISFNIFVFERSHSLFGGSVAGQALDVLQKNSARVVQGLLLAQHGERQ